jgi:2-keto-3-deoxy-L-arabinonate dehydratase
MKEGGIIDCDAPRRPLVSLHPDVRTGLMETARRLNPMVLRAGR